MGRIVLDEAEIAAYVRDGFLRLPGLIRPREAARVRRRLERLFARSAGRRFGDSFDLVGSDDEDGVAHAPQMLAPSVYDPALLLSAARQQAFAVARVLLGPDAALRGDHSFYKPARLGAPTPLHQDEAYWRGSYDAEGCSVWIALGDVGPDGGCMQFVAGSHRLGLRMHRSLHGDTRVQALEIAGLAGEPASVPLRAGDATVHHARTIHGATANTTDVPRFAYIFTFERPERLAVERGVRTWLASRMAKRDERAERTGAREALHARRRDLTLLVASSRRFGAFARRYAGARRWLDGST